MNSPKRAAFLFDPMWTSGPQLFFQRVTEHLPRFGWTCKIILPGTDNEWELDVSQFKAPWQATRTAHSAPILAKRLARAIRKFQPQVVVGIATDAPPLVMRYLYRTGQSTAHFVDTIQLDVPSEYSRVRRNADVAAAIGAVSAASVEKARRSIPELAARAYRIYYPVPCLGQPPAPRLSAGPLRVVYFGRVIQKDKRIMDLVPLVAGLLARRVDFRLTILGDGPDRPRLQQAMAAIPGAHERIRFTGWLDNAEALRVISEEDVLLLVSEAEGQPIAMLEAMALGLAPVVTDLPGMHELVTDERNGFLIPVGDVDGFISRIAELATYRPVLDRMSHAAWETIRDTHGMNAAVRHFADMLDTVSQLPLPDTSKVPEDIYPSCICTRWHMPGFVQEILHWTRGREMR